MIEFGATLALVTIAAYIIAMIEPTRDTIQALVRLLDGVEQHRRAQATGVMHHAGLLPLDTDDE